ncbi:hypothetical protein BSM4216_1738 [Bacillus smithii]|nr:hypothetical protein BSM4216_1738 [Bacillus smithii]
MSYGSAVQPVWYHESIIHIVFEYIYMIFPCLITKAGVLKS